MKQLLDRPVEYGAVRLAPTSELAGLAELAELRDHRERLDAIMRIASTIRAEDEVRDQIDRLRQGADAAPALPRRR